MRPVCSVQRSAAKPVADGDALDVGARRLARATDRHAHAQPAGRGRSAHRCSSALGRRPVRDREVLAVHLARGDRARQRRHRGERLADHHQARGVLVEPVHDAGARQRGAAGSRASSAFSNVPDQLPAAGCTTMPAALSITSRSRPRTPPRAASPRRGRRGSRRSAAARPRCAGRRARAAPCSSTAAPSSVTWPSLDQLLQVVARELGRHARRRALSSRSPCMRGGDERVAPLGGGRVDVSPSVVRGDRAHARAGDPRPYKIRHLSGAIAAPLISPCSHETKPSSPRS